MATIEDDETMTSVKDVIESFLTFSGCKLLITFHLKDIINNFLASHKTNKRSLKRKSKMPKRKDEGKSNVYSNILADLSEEGVLKDFHGSKLSFLFVNIHSKMQMCLSQRRRWHRR